MITSHQNNPWIYQDLLYAFQEAGYEFVFFDGLTKQKGQIALRHDIDFDTHFALQCARIEHQMGICSTFFFLMRSELYNIFSPANYENVLAIKKLGHKVSIHFDPTTHQDFHKGLEKEVQVFQNIFDAEVDLISIHRPNEFFQKLDKPIAGIEHTYQSKYFRDTKYIADSTGVWRFGHPVDTQEFANRQNLHVLIHPIWWMVNGEDNIEKLRKYYGDRVRQLNEQFYLNCIPFRQIHDQV